MSQQVDVPRGCPPSLALERALSGEIEGSSSAVWIEHIESCQQCQRALGAMEQAGGEYEQSSEAAELLRLLEQRQRAPRKSRPWVALLAAVSVLGGALWLVRGSDELGKMPEPTWQAKGGGVLSVMVVRDGARLEPSGQALRQGDVVQLSWTSERPGYLAIWARDREGEVELVFPEQETRAQRMLAGAELEVGPGLSVEAETRDSTLWAVHSRRPVLLAPFREQLERTGTIQPRGDVGQVATLKLDVEESVSR